MTVVVLTPGDLEKQLNSRNWSAKRLLIRSPLLTQSEIAQWQEKLDGLRQACGCTHGALALCAFLAIFIGYSIWTDRPAGVPADVGTILIRSAVFVLGLVASAIAGKLFGIYRARVQFRKACSNLKSRLSSLSAVSELASTNDPPHQVGSNQIPAHSS